MKTSSLSLFESNPDALFWAYFNTLQFRIPGQAVLDIAHPGPADSDVARWVDRVRELTAQLYAGDENNPWNPTADKIRAELAEYGAWSDDELANDAQNWHRLLWIAACNIAEDDAPDFSEPVTK